MLRSYDKVGLQLNWESPIMRNLMTGLLCVGILLFGIGLADDNLILLIIGIVFLGVGILLARRLK